MTAFKYFLQFLGVVFGGLLITFFVLFVLSHRDRRPEIYFAAESGDTNALAAYLKKGSNVNSPVISYVYGVHTSPLLNIAALNKRPDAVILLLKNGANPNLTNSAGYSVLGCSLENEEDKDSLRVIQILLNAGADPNLPYGQDKRFALMGAATYGKNKALALLINAGARVNATNASGMTALHFAKDAETAKLLMAASAGPTLKAYK